ncbi:Transcription factor iws1 [Elasticomyces elasticus]|nr:Transcription factor iws1 [Elasticomyces elasticus]KAK5010754.1 hypothetical protein LTR28_008001 [Elasticomyces elasticus]
MEALSDPGSPDLTNENDLPEANHDPGDPLAPEIEEEDAIHTPPMAAPQLDTEVVEDDPLHTNSGGASDADSDALSDVDEAQFDDFDPSAINIEKPAVVDETNVGLLGVHKRKRKEGEEGEVRKKKRKDGRREKPKKRRKAAEEDDGDIGGVELDGKRTRKGKAAPSREERRRKELEDEEGLSPEERRKRALDRRMDEALAAGRSKRPGKRAGIDLEAAADAELENMRKRMADAAQADTTARDEGKPAMQKLKLLPEVVALLNRNTLQSSLVDPDINLLESVRFFLEPLNDGSLPAYNIQRELFACLAKLPIGKDTLVASGIGKVVYFYTKSPRAEMSIKRQAERLIGEWTRPILKRSDDYRKREFQEAHYDPTAIPVRSAQTDVKAAKAAAARRAALAQPTLTNRARPEGTLASYSIVPKNNMAGLGDGRRIGASGDEAFRRMKARQLAKAGSRGR